jgi:hypothetical protein
VKGLRGIPTRDSPGELGSAMSVCACGRTTNDGRTACDRCAALALFGLTRAATPTEIKDAYRVLAKVWHPDRFQSDEDLRQKAEEKLKEINSAYQLLTTTAAEGPNGSSSTPVSPAEESPRSSARAAAAASTRAPHQYPRASHVNISFRTKERTNKKRLVVTLAILLAAGFSIYVWFTQMTSSVTNDARTETVRKNALPTAAIGQSSKEKKQLSKPATNTSAVTAETMGAHSRTRAVASNRASLVVYPDEDPQVPYFTVGSTKDDVIRIQGPPNKAAGNLFVYGLSEVYFENGRVQSWQMDSSSPLKARMPQH